MGLLFLVKVVYFVGVVVMDFGLFYDEVVDEIFCWCDVWC